MRLGHRLRAAALALPALGVAGHADASDAEACIERSGNLQIDVGVCSRAIASRAYSGLTLSSVLVARGESWLGLGRPERALADFDRALAENPASATARLGRADVFRLQRRYEAALEELRSATALSPTYYTAWIRVALVEYIEGRLEASLAASERALGIDAHGAEAYLLRGLSHFQSGHGAAASRDLSHASALGHDYEYLPLWIAHTRQRAGAAADDPELRRLAQTLAAEEWPRSLVDGVTSTTSRVTVDAVLAEQHPELAARRRSPTALFLGHRAWHSGEGTAARALWQEALASATTGFDAANARYALELTDTQGDPGP